jgi:hypothetical protein
MTPRAATEVIGTERVRRCVHSGSAKIQSLLRHYRAAGFDFVPIPLTISDEREELSYLPGRCYLPTEPRPASAWDDAHLETLGVVLRRCHDQSVSFLSEHGNDGWFPNPEPCAHSEVICHNDVGPWNVPIDGQRLGLIDWEMAAPGLRIWDVAHAAWNWVPLFPPEERERMGVTQHWLLDCRLDRLLTAYGLDRWTHSDIFEAVLERQERVMAIKSLARSSGAVLLSNWLNVDDTAISADRVFVELLLRGS